MCNNIYYCKITVQHSLLLICYFSPWKGFPHCVMITLFKSIKAKIINWPGNWSCISSSMFSQKQSVKMTLQPCLCPVCTLICLFQSSWQALPQTSLSLSSTLLSREAALPQIPSIHLSLIPQTANRWMEPAGQIVLFREKKSICPYICVIVYLECSAVSWVNTKYCNLMFVLFFQLDYTYLSPVWK